MNKKVLSLLQYAFFLGLGLFLVWWPLHKISKSDWTEIRQAFSSVHYTLIIPVVITLLASHYSRALRWRILMEPLGYTPKKSNTYIAVLIGYLANLFVPRLGEILKCTLLARYEKIPAEKLVGTIVAERAFDLICLVIVMSATFISQADIIGSYLSEQLHLLVLAKAGGLSWMQSAIWGGGLLLFLLLIWYLLRTYAHIHFVQKTKVILQGIWHGLTSVRLIRHKGWFFFHTAFIWAMYLISIQIGMWAMKDTAGYGLKESLSALSTGSIAMILTPSGIGAYPIFIQETMLLYGLKETIGFAFGWLMWTVQFFLILTSGALAFVLLPYFNKKPQHA